MPRPYVHNMHLRLGVDTVAKLETLAAAQRMTLKEFCRHILKLEALKCVKTD